MNPAVGPLCERLKWGEASYSAEASGSGTSVRLAWKPMLPGHDQVLVHCRTDLVQRWRAILPNGLRTAGNRALELGIDQAWPEPALRQCLAMALTYRLDRKPQKPAPGSAR